MPLCHVAGYLTPLHQFHGGTVLMMSGLGPGGVAARCVQTHRGHQRRLRADDDADAAGAPEDRRLRPDAASEWMGYGASKIPVDVLRRTIERFGPVVYAGHAA